MIAAACLTLAAIHTHVWLRQRRVQANGAFALLCTSVAWMTFNELQQLSATTPEQFLAGVWWNQVPVFFGVVATVLFVRTHMHAGRTWLAVLAIGTRGLDPRARLSGARWMGRPGDLRAHGRLPDRRRLRSSGQARG